MSKILLQCNSSSDTRFLKNLFETSAIDYEVRVQTSQNNTSSKSYLAYETVNLFVFVAPTFTERDYKFLSEVKSKYYDRGLLVLSEKVAYKEFYKQKKRKGIHLLEKPFGREDLLGLAERLIKDPFSKQQQFKRYITRQQTILESLTSGKSGGSTMINLSMGGGFFETDNVDFYNVDDLVRLRIPLAEMSREHNLIGKVVWRTIQHQKTGRAGIGLEFVKKGDLYQQLVRKMQRQNPAMAHFFE